MKQAAKQGKKQIALTLNGNPLENFQLFKNAKGFESDAEAARVLITERLGQLKRRGALAKAA